MSKIIAVANQKGGVGKTTTTVNLSACIAQAGKRVLCVDLDPQGNSTSGLGVDKEAPEYSIYDVLINDVAPAQAVVPTQIEGLDLLSSRKELSGAEVELELREGADTLEQYPFSFRLGIRYRLRGEAVEIACTVENTGDAVMPFALGGHPGFRVPLEAGERFEDYRLEFSQTCQPDRVGFTPAVYLSGRDDAYPLEEGRYLPLRHDLFDQDAVILKNMARQVTLRSRVTGKGVEVTYPDMPYLGIWHWPKTDAPYVCIEPWTSLPSRQDVVEEFTCKSDLIHLAPGKVYENTWTIRIIK